MFARKVDRGGWRCAAYLLAVSGECGCCGNLDDDILAEGKKSDSVFVAGMCPNLLGIIIAALVPTEDKE